MNGDQTENNLAKVRITLELDIPSISEDMDPEIQLGHVNNVCIYCDEFDCGPVLPVELVKVVNQLGEVLYEAG